MLPVVLEVDRSNVFSSMAVSCVHVEDWACRTAVPAMLSGLECFLSYLRLVAAASSARLQSTAPREVVDRSLFRTQRLEHVAWPCQRCSVLCERAAVLAVLVPAAGIFARSSPIRSWISRTAPHT